MSSEDSVESTVKGATKGLLEWTEEKIIQAVKQFIDKNIAFVEDPETIKLMKEQREKGELDIFKGYIKDKDLHVLFQMGLVLRHLEKENKDFEPLKKKIKKKYFEKGLRVAYFVQNGLFNKYIGNLLDKGLSSTEIKSEIENLFENIDNVVAFVSHTDKIVQKINEIITKIQAHSPETFIISSIGAAIDVCEQIKNGVMQGIINYECEEYISEVKSKQIYFLNRISEI